MKPLSYDKTDPKSIEQYAKQLIGQTFQDIINQSPDCDAGQKYANKNRKGGLGNLLEEVYFGYKANSDSDADFKEAGIELKATPYELTKDGRYRAGERLVLTMIDYRNDIETDFFKSHVWEKCQKILLVYYLRDRSLHSNLHYPIHYVSLFTPNDADLAIIQDDYRIIAQKIAEGRAHELSEADTMYLGACTKGATAETSLVPQHYAPHLLAKKRAFCYKNSYMTYVLNEYLISQNGSTKSERSSDVCETTESIVKDVSELSGKTFSQLIISRINAFKGKSDKELCAHFNREYNNNKAQWTSLAYRMLGIKSNAASEFQKANIVVKVIRLEENGSMNEHMSLPAFKYKEIIQEQWEDSALHNYFDETKFLFVVFKRKEDVYYLQGAQFWNMPYRDLNTTVKEGWEKVVDTIRQGIQFEIVQTKSGEIVKNNLPGISENRIVHVRPHASKRFFRFFDGKTIGNVADAKANANELPDGTFMPNYSFWLNSKYILSQLHLED